MVFWVLPISGVSISWGCCNILRGVRVLASSGLVRCSGFDCFWVRLLVVRMFVVLWV